MFHLLHQKLVTNSLQCMQHLLSPTSALQLTNKTSGKIKLAQYDFASSESFCFIQVINHLSVRNNFFSELRNNDVIKPARQINAKLTQGVRQRLQYKYATYLLFLFHLLLMIVFLAFFELIVLIIFPNTIAEVNQIASC